MAIGSPVLNRDIAFFDRNAAARSLIRSVRWSVSLISVTALAANSLDL